MFQPTAVLRIGAKIFVFGKSIARRIGQTSSAALINCVLNNEGIRSCCSSIQIAAKVV